MAVALHPSSNAWIKDGKYTTFGQKFKLLKVILLLLKFVFQSVDWCQSVEFDIAETW